jgi:hypothetical protein
MSCVCLANYGASEADLSRATFLKMRAIANDGRVKACWSTKGQIKFVLLKSPNEVRKVISLLDPLEDMLK